MSHVVVNIKIEFRGKADDIVVMMCFLVQLLVGTCHDINLLSPTVRG